MAYNGKLPNYERINTIKQLSIDGLSLIEIAKKLGLTEAAVRSLSSTYKLSARPRGKTKYADSIDVTLPRVCKTCGELKILRGNKCDKCINQRRYLHKLVKFREYVNSHKTACVVCGETEKCCIDFHHIRNKFIEISKIVRYSNTKKGRLIFDDEVKKCVCICSNCHMKLHAGLLSLEGGV